MARTSDLSLRGAKRRGNLAGPGWITWHFRRNRNCLPEIATSAYGLLAMTNLEASRHRRNAVLVASLHGAHYPQGARRIRKAAKPPTAAQGAPLQTQSVRAILTIAGSNRQCAAGRGAPSQRKSRGPSGSAKNPGLRFAVPEIFCGFSIRPYRRSRGRP